MATALYRASARLRQEHSVERWFFPGMAALMIATSVAGFAPAILNPASRRAPLSPLAAVHGLVFFAWQILFLVQTLLVKRRIAWHRRLGLASVFLLASMIPLGCLTTVTMMRRGFDLSGDQKIEPHPLAGHFDPLGASIFNFGYLFTFTVLAVAAIGFRSRPAIHKRLMLFANIELLGAPIAHLLGHIDMLTGPMIMISLSLFLLIAAARDHAVEKRIHPLTVTLAILLLVLQPVEGALIGPSRAWHHIAAWLAG